MNTIKYLQFYAVVNVTFNNFQYFTNVLAACSKMSFVSNLFWI